MPYEYLRRGVLAGVVAGLAYGSFVAFVANPFGEYLRHARHDHVHEHARGVSETTAAVVSVGSGVLWAIFLGGVFALALYVLEPALPGRGTASAFVLAGAGFLTVSVTPWLVLPPAAPGAEQLYGVETRLAIYAGLVALGAVVSAVAIVTYAYAAPRHPALGVVAGGVPIVTVAIVLPWLTPTIVTHPGLPGELVSAYRGMVVLSQAAIWATLAAAVGWLQRRDRAPDTAESNERFAASPHR
ncbi:CbtA family protein [Natronococcus wangiae]|uniref:CbtA family protein n=1 Tax=Natronococcus wangiae TaxID=3068275 RepID=UPI00273F71F0|nr:CbtA family protein [Natronococcus sp. AD5]